MAEISLQEALQQFLLKSKMKEKVQALEIKDVWEELMGKTIASYTENIQLINQQLIITTPIAALKNELLFQKEKIRNRVNERFNYHAVKEVVIR
ncbi:MAG: DUF721 domain-containing protein [Bacteroidota bacterium]|jgi:predicted nucleic acid-binding Zn ribbon protein